MPQPPPGAEQTNSILDSLEKADLARLRPHLETLHVDRGLVLFDIDDTIEYVYFPVTSMISVVNSTLSGQTAEVGVIGREGMGGIEGLLKDLVSINRHIIQLPGEMMRARASVIKEEFDQCGGFQKAALEFTTQMIAQMSQTALCNRIHTAEQRLAKWLLMCHDRAYSDVMPITQEFAAIMLGSNRTSVTLAAGHLQTAGLIGYSRGKITILDRKGLEKFSCECYARLRIDIS